MAGTNYKAVSGTLTFSPGTLSQTISVPIDPDTTAKPNETFQVNLSNAQGASLGNTVGHRDDHRHGRGPARHNVSRGLVRGDERLGDRVRRTDHDQPTTSRHPSTTGRWLSPGIARSPRSGMRRSRAIPAISM